MYGGGDCDEAIGDGVKINIILRRLPNTGDGGVSQMRSRFGDGDSISGTLGKALSGGNVLAYIGDCDKLYESLQVSFGDVATASTVMSESTLPHSTTSDDGEA